MTNPPDDGLACHDYGPEPSPPSPTPRAWLDIENLYQQAMTRSGLPHRSPSHRIAEQLAATAEAAAYAQALALLTGSRDWKGRAVERARNLRDRSHMDQREIDSAEHAESKLRRYGLH